MRRFGLSRKFTPPPPAIAMESQLTELVPTDSFKRAKLREYYVSKFTNLARGGTHNPFKEIDLTQADLNGPTNSKERQTLEKQALMNAMAVQLNALMNGDLNKKIDNAFIEEFQKWLRGLSCYNADLTRTPWGTKRLVGDDIYAYLGQFVDRKFELEKFLTKLKLAPPQDIKSAWLYFKYIVAGLDPDGEDYLPEFDWLTDPAKMAQAAKVQSATITGTQITKDGTTKTVTQPISRSGAQDAGAIYPLPQQEPQNSLGNQFFICKTKDVKQTPDSPITENQANTEADEEAQDGAEGGGGVDKAEEAAGGGERDDATGTVIPGFMSKAIEGFKSLFPSSSSTDPVDPGIAALNELNRQERDQTLADIEARALKRALPPSAPPAQLQLPPAPEQLSLPAPPAPLAIEQPPPSSASTALSTLGFNFDPPPGSSAMISSAPIHLSSKPSLDVVAGVHSTEFTRKRNEFLAEHVNYSSRLFESEGKGGGYFFKPGHEKYRYDQSQLTIGDDPVLTEDEQYAYMLSHQHKGVQNEGHHDLIDPERAKRTKKHAGHYFM